MRHDHRPVWPLLLLISAACPDGGDKDDLMDHITAGGADICARVGEAPEPDTGFTGGLDGEVVSDGAGAELDPEAPCADSDRVLQVLGDDGETYHVGYSLRDAEGGSLTESIPLASGDQVRLELLATIGYFYQGYGLVVRQDDHLVAVIADNKQPELSELTVSEGDAVASSTDDCGTRWGWQQVFSADETLALSPVSSGSLTVAGVPMTAWALAAWDYEDPTCSDTIGYFEWAVMLDP